MAAPEAKMDAALLLDIVPHAPRVLRYSPLRKRREVMTAAVKLHPRALRYAPRAVRHSAECVLGAVEAHWRALEHCPPSPSYPPHSRTAECAKESDGIGIA